MVMCLECAAMAYINHEGYKKTSDPATITKCQKCSKLRCCAEYIKQEKEKIIND